MFVYLLLIQDHTVHLSPLFITAPWFRHDVRRGDVGALTQNFSCPSLRLFRMRWVFSRPPRPAVARGNPRSRVSASPPIPPGQELREPAQCATSVPYVSTVRRAVRRSVWRRSVLFQRRRAAVGAVHPAVGPANPRRRDYLAESRASRYPLGWRLVDLGCALYYTYRV